MEANSQDGKIEYLSPRRIQVRFLRRSRDGWKRKCVDLTKNQKRLQNEVNDVRRSREKWRTLARELEQQLKASQSQATALTEQVDLKKEGQRDGIAGR